jgi:prepilin-type N-terminal cleavage/methylation domain-containing protein
MKRGFTLIELLVTIAIIGSLASIVIGALSLARDKAYDTKIKSNLSNMRSAAALYYTENGNYGVEVSDDCAAGMFAEDNMSDVLDSVIDANGGDTVNLDCYTSDSTAGSTSNTWAVSSPLRQNTSEFWCTDSNGYAGLGTSQLVADSAVCQ